VVRVSTGDWRAPAIAGALLLGCFAIFAVMRATGSARHKVEQAD
jgi:hypothetical protein